jgi:FAD/FMN-containing dehydrogenase
LKGHAVTTTEYEFALDLSMRAARRDVVRPLTGREVAIAVRHSNDQQEPVSLDLSAMRRIVIDPADRTARIQPGVSTADLETAAAAWRLAPLTDHRGLAPANLIAAQVVRADGALVGADEALLREIRTGHAFGIVVEATYRLHPAGELGR